MSEAATGGALLGPMFKRKYDKAIADLDRADRFAIGRPEGCFCLGAGELNGRWCECPDGVAAKAMREQQQRRISERDLQSWVENAGLPPRFADCTWETYPGPARFVSVLKGLAGQGKYSAFLCGPYGTGKTGLACGFLRRRVADRHEGAYFITVPVLLDKIRATFDSGAEDNGVLARAKSTRFLVLDDLGAEKATEWVQERLYVILNHRHDQLLDTCITSNLTLDQLAERIGERTVWRIAEMCEVVAIDGPNLREGAR